MSAALNQDTGHQDTNTDTAPPMPPGSRAPRRNAKLDHATLTITTPDENGASTYHVDALPEPVKRWATMQGVWTFMRMSDDPDAAFARLQSGNLPKQRTGEKKPPKPNTWRLAMAHAMVEKTRKSDSPMTLDAALDRVRATSRADLVKAKLAPLVIKHFHRLNGSDPDQSLAALI